MQKKELKSPELIEKFCVGKEKISPCIEKWEYLYGKEKGYVYACHPYMGVQLWNNDVYMQRMPVEAMEKYHFLKLNYCTKGRCEVSIENDKYVYIEEGILSLDSNPPKDEFVYPQGRYEGLEIIFDLEAIKEHPLTAFFPYGINILKINEELKSKGGSYLATVSKEWRIVADHLMELLRGANGTIEDYRFGVLHLMYLSAKGHTRPLEKKYYLTKGQKKIAMEVEARISRDLKHRYTVEEMAMEYGISPSSLKKYFEQVYGSPISKYLREKRMEQASILLRETRNSVADIAAECGYANQGKFSAVFKEYAGASPLEYRRLQFERRNTK